MSEFRYIKKETLNEALKPFDIVTNKHGHVGFIVEVNLNDCQPSPEHQVGYSVNWIVGSGDKCAWFKDGELTYHANLFVEIAKASCHNMGGSRHNIGALMNNLDR